MKQFKRDENQNSNKLHLDKYYTPILLARYCINKTYEVIGKENITEIIEPSAGNGSFSNQIEGCIAYDIEPENENVLQQDFLELKLEYEKGRLFIGNPPFGDRMNLATQFIKRCYEYGDYIAFILPISQYENNYKFYEFDLIHSENLGVQIYTDREVHCCLNIYKRPKNGLLNKKKQYNFKDFTLYEQIKNQDPKRNKPYPDNNYDFRICTWGASCGRILKDNESYAKEVAFYVYNPNMKSRIKEVIENMNIHKDFFMTSTPNLLLWQIYEYILKRIPELNVKAS
jgi:predicted RNA methylase